MGLVFRASDQQLERDVAVKVLPPGMLADEAARKRFRREALALAKLNHPNIGTVYEFGSQEGLDFLVMEYVGGVAVDARLASGPLTQKEVLRLGFQLADGLASAHEHGVIHRDLKPANMRLTEDNRLKILDFGLAQFVRQETDLSVTASISDSKDVTGTLPYMSPEQLRGELTDQRSDIWSAGAVLYELVTGRRPFPFAQVPRLIDAIMNKPPEMPSALNPKISPGLEVGNSQMPRQRSGTPLSICPGVAGRPRPPDHADFAGAPWPGSRGNSDSYTTEAKDKYKSRSRCCRRGRSARGWSAFVLTFSGEAPGGETCRHTT